MLANRALPSRWPWQEQRATIGLDCAVHRRFKVMIIQTENGHFRLSKEFRELDCDALENYVRICPPPPFGTVLSDARISACNLPTQIAEFQPDIVISIRGMQRHAMKRRANILRPLTRFAPFCRLVTMLRRLESWRTPQTENRRTRERTRLAQFVGWLYVLGSVPRQRFVMQAASDDTTDNRIVWTCCKNNDGELGARSAWERRNGLFAPVQTSIGTVSTIHTKTTALRSLPTIWQRFLITARSN